ncbi:glutamyl-tRNA(Gln) amidotransferase subunit F ASCRUDRAFT_72918 [Ascoidea rubescens DSM 1968]|uniref:Glu-AdT subunit F n=1 Tax=Ascoidea rubescens DSM 1968 TaxID=1344418 RepID=A0A1D2V922_9ASCO|nr:hypothetical protein ASCRUDRAFT_72918 [Ascoidea rubescens DSM 1968]ODV58059.1 hypothetical protein ASCRUDRAFT_72918 [Ascoidea rubescens DSM 1968]
MLLRPISRCFIRYNSTNVASVGKPFKSLEEIKKFLAAPSWNPKDFVLSDKTVGDASSEEKLVTTDELKYLLRLSNLKLPQDEQDQQSLLNELNNQIKFVNSLHSLPTSSLVGCGGDLSSISEQIRLSSSSRILDNNPVPLNFDELMSSISSISNSVDAEKGEVSSSWGPMELTSNPLNDHQYVVVEKP